MVDIEKLKATAIAANPDDWRIDYSAEMDAYRQASDPVVILALLERLQVAEDAAKDAERLNWIADQDDTFKRSQILGLHFIKNKGVQFHGKTFRDAIDAARRLTP